MSASAAAAARAIRPLAGEFDTRMRSFLRAIVDVPSHSSEPDGVARVGAMVATELAAAGCECRTVTPPPLDPGLDWLARLMLPDMPYDDGADVIGARRRGDDHGSTVLVLGDLDTSFREADFPGFHYRERAGRSYGPGIADMKGGLAVLAAALHMLERSGLASPTIVVVLSSDEQAGSLRSRAVIESLASGADWCLCVECARDGGKLMASRAQVGVGLLDVWGREAHAGSARSAGVSAARELSRIVPDCEDLTDEVNGIYVTVGLMQAGRRRSVVPGHGWCVLDVRTPNADAWECTESALRRLVEPRTPGCSSRLQTHSHRPAVLRTAATDRLTEIVAGAGDPLGLSVTVTNSGAAGSSAFAGGSCAVTTLDGMGPAGGDLMTDHEYIETDSLVSRASLLALSLHLLADVGPSHSATPTEGR